MHIFRKVSVLAIIVALLAWLAVPALSTGQTGGGILHFGNVRAFVCEVTFTDAAAATKVQLPVAWGKPDVWWNTQGSVAASELAITLDLDNYVFYGDGSTVDPDGIFTGSGLDDPLFVNLGNITTTFQVEFVCVTGTTFKSRISAADEQGDVTKFGPWGSYTAAQTFSETVYANGAGLGVDWNDATGPHTAGDKWLVQVYFDDVYLGAKAGQISAARTDLDGTAIAKPIFVWLDQDITY